MIFDYVINVFWLKKPVNDTNTNKSNFIIMNQTNCRLIHQGIWSCHIAQIPFFVRFHLCKMNISPSVNYSWENHSCILSINENNLAQTNALKRVIDDQYLICIFNRFSDCFGLI